LKRLALAVAALAALATLTSCSDDSSSDDSTPKSTPSVSESESASDTESEAAAEEPTEDATTGDPERFATAYAQVSALFTELNASQPDTQPTSTEEANTAAGLDDTTPLVFADYSVLPDDTGGSLCLLSADTGTYIAVSYSGTEGEVDLGDGECSYDTGNALVVGDVATDTWTLGAEYMADSLPSGVFGS
jgi:hypothetical protein